MPSAGDQVSHYRITGRLGGGGMGVVYRAEDQRLGRAVALKFLPSHLASDAAAVARLEREARAASGLNHPNICTVYEIGEHDGQRFIAMELIDGETLSARIGGRAMPAAVLLDLALQIADALDAAHSGALIHRDLKPDNILVTPRGQVKLLDFGLVKHIDVSDETQLAASANLTDPGSAVGTVAYMSPEQARGEPLDARSDVFSLGLILYEMATGRAAFSGPTTAVIFDAILNRDVLAASRVVASVPAPLERLIGRAMAKEPARRPASGREMLEALRSAQREMSGHAKPDSGSTAKAVPSIAVLPFADLSPGHDQQYFCEGMAEEVTTLLSSLSGLRVASRTSAARCREKGLELSEIGQKLGVQAVLEGSVRKAGNRLRIAAQLTNVGDGFQLWAERYDRDMDDVFEIQEQIGRAIADALKVKLTGGEVAPAANRGTENMEAYNLYLKGRYHWERRNSWSVKTALDCFTQAVAADPGYAMAHVGLADAYVVSAIWGHKPTSAMLPLATEAVERALAIDPNLPEALHTRGAICHWLEYDWTRAEAFYQRALAGQPRLALTHGYRAVLLASLGRRAESAEAGDRGIHLEPDSALAAFLAAGAAYWAGDVPRALSLSDRALAIDPATAHALWTRTMALSMLGHHDEAVAAGQQGATILSRQIVSLSALGSALVRAGRHAEGQNVLDEVWARGKTEYVGPAWAANILACFPDRQDETCSVIERAYDERAPLLVTLGAPHFDAVRPHPRFQAVLRRMHLGG
jgi:non-specific serine/threonine protein kinase